ncbi:MAG TPA: hypothetical protein PLB18_10380 [Acidobacteriota bacterium]|nr:hypothetical protein [Acidobacteriota bacterium]HND19773.1 hypothetical protein [Acidobacteriota bacterium]
MTINQDGACQEHSVSTAYQDEAYNLLLCMHHSPDTTTLRT